MSIDTDIADMTVRMQSEKPSTVEVYQLLLRALLEIRRLKHTIAVLQDTGHKQ